MGVLCCGMQKLVEQSAPTPLGAMESGKPCHRQNLDRWRSTYAQCYVPDPKQVCEPIMKYHQPPSIQNPRPNFVSSHKFLPGYIPKLMYCRPPGYVKNAPQALGLGTFTNPTLERNMKMKPITRGVPPKRFRQVGFPKVELEDNSKYKYHSLREGTGTQETRNTGLDMTTLTISEMTDKDLGALDSIYTPAVWTTMCQRNHLQAALPKPAQQKPESALEESANPVQYKASRYNEAVEPWQRFSTKWDRVQIRPICKKARWMDGKPLTKASSDPEEEEQVEAKPEEKGADLVPHSGLRQIPGYRGYVPRLPIVRRENHESLQQYVLTDVHKTTTNRRTYTKHELPKAPVKIRPMSKMVALVHPSNPFKLAKTD